MTGRPEPRIPLSDASERPDAHEQPEPERSQTPPAVPPRPERERASTRPGGPRLGGREHLVQVVHLEPADDTAVIRDHLRRAQSQRVILVVPADCHALERDVALRLLGRYATMFGQNVALVTDNRQTWRFARRLGFSTYSTSRQAQTARRWSESWRPPPRSSRPREGGHRPAHPALHEASRQAPATRAERTLTVLVFAALVILLAGGTLLVVPSAQVSVVPATIAVSTRLPVQFDPEIERIQYELGKIPARLVDLKLEGSADAATTGREDVADARATGQVLFINRVALAITVPRGTVVSASSGMPVKFQTVQEITVPPGVGQRAVAVIEAVDPGPRGNVPVLVINRVEGPLALSLQVVNNQPTSGGDVKQVAVVTAADKRTLRQLLLARLRQEALTALSEQMEEGEFLPAETVDIWTNKEIFDRAVDEQAETLRLTLRVQIQGLVVSDVAAASLARQALYAQVPAQYRLQEGAVEYQRGPIERIEQGTLFFTMEVAGTAVAEIDTAAVREEIAGQPLSEARTRLVEGFPLASDPVIRITPQWFRHMPWLSYRVFVHVLEQPLGGET